ncbi:hypothetical protein HCN44_008686 [Aphidius gifuensis]|uniref:26S proteasome non-ATPase regulatory subunit 5 n=1 Tax=Aphidius gifuensis TaxID=684658 RepID=A0A834XNF7_APHGI|nr:26S proteasome non-ATPase regulatory subunit 5 [Aphidius gifuensis]KAF7990012.1 hypothetical protein HCN44_008686 [Aphidius gifuensis]
MIEWFERKIISIDENTDNEIKKETLEDFKIKLRSLTSIELHNVAQNLDFTRLFSQLTSNDSIYNEEVCNNLSTLFSVLEAGEVFKRFPMEMSQFIIHEDPLVKKLVLKELLKTASSENSVTQLINDKNILNLVIEEIGKDDLVVAKIAMDVIKQVGKSPAGVKALYSSPLLTSLARLISKRGVISFRIYDVVVDIAKHSKENLDASATSGFLSSLINILQDDDVLLQLNALEVMAELASTDYGLNYLEERDVLKTLSDKIADANENPLSILLIPGLMRFFGKISKSHIDILSKYPPVIYALFDVINETEDTLLLTNALDTLGHIASTNDGKYALQNLGQFMNNAIHRISQVIKTMPSELKVCGLDCLAMILYVDKTKRDNQIMSLTKSWFDLINNDPLDMIIGYCRQPFHDIKISSYRVLSSISNQTWGHELIASYPGLIELLLARTTDCDKNIKEIRYEIIKNLSEAEDVFDSGNIQKFTTYVHQGPYFVDLETEVATEVPT